MTQPYDPTGTPGQPTPPPQPPAGPPPGAPQWAPHQGPPQGPAQGPAQGPPPGWVQQGPPPGYPYAPPQAARPLTSSSSRVLAWVALGAAVLVVLGSFMPWVNVPFLGAVSGTSGDGMLTLVLGLIAAGVAVAAGLGRAQLAMFAVAGIASLIALFIGIYDLTNVTSGMAELEDEIFTVALGPGLPMIVLGGFVAVGACVAGIVATRKLPKA